jgi:hypothetical protein
MLAHEEYIMNINIEKYLSPGTLIDLKRALSFKPSNRSLRLVRIPVEEFNIAIGKALMRNPYLPFTPVIFNNIPVDMTESLLPECVIIADDNTNLVKQDRKEIEIIKPEYNGVH